MMINERERIRKNSIQKKDYLDYKHSIHSIFSFIQTGLYSSHNFRIIFEKHYSIHSFHLVSFHSISLVSFHSHLVAVKMEGRKKAHEKLTA